MTPREIVKVTTVVAVDPATAFAIFTDEIGAWWTPKAEPLFRKGRTGTMRFKDGWLVETYPDSPSDPFEVGRVLQWVPGERLVFEWRQGDFGAEEKTEVEVRFEAAGNGTRVTLEHRGWESLPASHLSRHGYTGPAFENMIGLRWADLLTAFRWTARFGR